MKIWPWISVIPFLLALCSLLYCLCHVFFYFSLRSLCHSIISFYQSHFSLLSHPHLPLLSRSDRCSHILLCSSTQCEEVSAPPYGLSTYSAESVGGVLHFNSTALKKEREREREREREIICQMVVKQAAVKPFRKCL